MCWSWVNKACVGSTAKPNISSFVFTDEISEKCTLCSRSGSWGPLRLARLAFVARKACFTAAAELIKRKWLQQIWMCAITIVRTVSLRFQSSRPFSIRSDSDGSSASCYETRQQWIECENRESPFRQNSWKKRTPMDHKDLVLVIPKFQRMLWMIWYVWNVKLIILFDQTN